MFGIKFGGSCNKDYLNGITLDSSPATDDIQTRELHVVKGYIVETVCPIGKFDVTFLVNGEICILLVLMFLLTSLV